jgi:hypothetical protein
VEELAYGLDPREENLDNPIEDAPTGMLECTFCQAVWNPKFLKAE